MFKELLLPPNILSLLRLFSALPSAWCLALKNYPCAGILYLFGAVSDFLDGLIARRFGMETRLGIILDPLADKVLILSYISVLYIGEFKYKPSEWLLFFVLLKEFVVALGFPLVRRGIIFKPNLWGKLSTALLFADGLLLLYGNWKRVDITQLQKVLEVFAAFTLSMASLLYLKRGLEMFVRKRKV